MIPFLRKKYHNKTYYFLLCLLLCLVYYSIICIFNISFAEIIPDLNDTNIQIQTINNTPVLNINKPDNIGVSKNNFKDYNVLKNGLVINNSNIDTQSQLLDTTIKSNPNLVNGNTANVIINEVKGNNITQLLGKTEIAGSKAELVIINPNGIYVDGAGFINTSKLTLDSKKDINIVNFDASTVDETKLNANTISVNKGGIALTNRITLIASGVNINGNLISNFDDIDITSEGTVLVKGKIETKDGDINIKANELINEGTEILDKGVNKNNYVVKESIPTGNPLPLYETALTSVERVKEVNLKVNPAEIKANGNINIESNDISNISSNITAVKDINITTNLLDADRIGFDATMTYVNTYKDKKRRHGVGSNKIKLRDRSFNKNQFVYSSIPSFIGADNIFINATKQLKQDELQNRIDPACSEITANNELNIYTAEILNMGKISSTNGSIYMEIGNSLNNHGGIISAKDDIIIKSTGTINNEALTISYISGSQKNMIFNAGEVKPSTISVDNGDIYLTFNKFINKGSLLESKNTIELNGDNIEIGSKELVNRMMLSHIPGEYLYIGKTENFNSGILSNNLNMRANKDIKISGSDMYTTNSINIEADNVSIKSATNTYDMSYRHQKYSSGFDVRMHAKSISTGETYETKTIMSEIETGGNININAQQNVDIGSVNIKTAGNINIDGNDIHLESSQDVYDAHSSKKHRRVIGTDTLKGGEHKATTIVSIIESSGNININSKGDTNIKSMDIRANNFDIQSDGNTIIDVNKDELIQHAEHTKKTVANLQLKAKYNELSGGVQSKISSSESTRIEAHEIQNTVKVNNFNIKANKNINIKGLTISADNEITLIAEQDVYIEPSKHELTENTKHKTEEVTIKYKIGNSYTDVVESTTSLSDNTKKLKQLVKEYDRIEQLYKEGNATEKALREIKLSILATTETIASSTLSLANNAAVAAGTTPLGGFYAGQQVETSVSTHETDLHRIVHTQNSIQANKININSKNAKIIGTELEGKNINIDVADNLSIESVQDRYEYTSSYKNTELGTNNVGFNTHIVDSVARQTQISGIKTDNLELNAKNLHMKGSVIDSNTNNINIEQLTAEDLKDTYHTHEHGVGVGVSISGKEKSLENTKSIFELKNKEYVKDDIIRSTITNTNLENINTDLSNVKETIRDQILSNADIKVVIDGKMFSKESLQNLKELPKNMVIIVNNVIDPIITGVINCIGLVKSNEIPEGENIATLTIDYTKEDLHYKQNKKLLTKLANKLSQTKQQQQNNKNNKKDKNNNNINNNDNNNIDLNNDLFEIAKTMPYTVKDKKDVKVITYYDDTPNCNVYGYTKYDKDTNTKIIGINLYTANTYKKVIETLYHESYSDKKHKLNEESAKAYSNHIAKRLKDIPDIDIDINKLNINKEELKENTKLAYNAFADYYTNKNTDVQFNTALIQDPIVNDIQQLLQLSPAIAISPEAVVIAAGTVSAYYAGKIIYTTVKDVIREREEKRKLEDKQLNDNNNILEPRLITAAQEQDNTDTDVIEKSIATTDNCYCKDDDGIDKSIRYGGVGWSEKEKYVENKIKYPRISTRVDRIELDKLERAYYVYKYAEEYDFTGKASKPKAFAGASKFHNSKSYLPLGDYREYDIEPYTQGICRGDYRIVVDKNTKDAYFTGDHYEHFIKFISKGVLIEWQDIFINE